MQSNPALARPVMAASTQPEIQQKVESKLTRQARGLKQALGDTSLVAIIALFSSLASIAIIVLTPILNQTRTNAVNEQTLKTNEQSLKAMTDGFAAVQTQLAGLKDDIRHAQEDAKRSTEDVKKVSDDMRAMRASGEAQMIDLRVRIDSASLDIGNVKTKLAAIEARQQERNK